MNCIICNKPVEYWEKGHARLCLAHFRCPICDAECGDFHELLEEEGDDPRLGQCDVAREKDEHAGRDQNETFTSKRIEAAALKKAGVSKRKECPCCKGKGWVEA